MGISARTLRKDAPLTAVTGPVAETASDADNRCSNGVGGRSTAHPSYSAKKKKTYKSPERTARPAVGRARNGGPILTLRNGAEFMNSEHSLRGLCVFSSLSNGATPRQRRPNDDYPCTNRGARLFLPPTSVRRRSRTENG